MTWILRCLFLWIVVTAQDYNQFPIYKFDSPDYIDEHSCTILVKVGGDIGFIEYYVNNSKSFHCWYIRSKDDTSLFMTVKFFYLAIPGTEYNDQFIPFPGQNCLPSNRVTVENSPWKYYESEQRKIFCDYQIPIPMTLFTSQMKIEINANPAYYSEAQKKNVGFRLQYQLFSPHQNLTVNFYDFITSAGYPYGMLEDGYNSWSITLSSNSTAKSLELVINDMRVYPEVYVQVYDGPDKTFPALIKFSDHSSRSISSSGPNLFVEMPAVSSSSAHDYKGFNITVKAKGYCLPGTFSCGDGENCYSASQRCDSTRDCRVTAVDEMGCHECKPDELWCGNKPYICLEKSQICNGKQDCSNKIDELDCVSCVSGAFFCNRSKSCVLESWKCDGQADCLFGEDEENCSSKYHDIVLQTYRFITSPDYPKWPPPNYLTKWNIRLSPELNLPIQLVMNEWRVDRSAYLEVYDGPSAEFPRLRILRKYDLDLNSDHVVIATSSGPYMFIQFYVNSGGIPTPGFYLRGFNATAKVKGYCLPGSNPCEDGENCYAAHQICDGKRNCEITGLDEKGCGACDSDEFWCGVSHTNSQVCYTESQRCNGHHDCFLTQVDEHNCKSCAPGAFLCKMASKCIYEKWRCDGQEDCKGKEDEIGCSYPASRKVITAAIVGSLVCGLLLAIALGCTCKLYTLRIAPNSRNRRSRTSPTTPLSRISRELLQREAPPSYNMTVGGTEHSADSSRRHSSSRRHRERRRRRRNREPRIRRAQPSQQRNEESTILLDTNRDDVVDSCSSRHVSTTSASEIDQTPRSSTSTPASSSTAVEVACVLAGMGLADYPDEIEQIHNPSPPDNSAGTSQSSVEPQAPPLPKKRPIPPVMVEAPFNTVMVDDIPSCVYPNPPSYHEATIDVPPSREETPSVSSLGDENQTKPSGGKEVLNKIWVKRSPNKIKKFFNFPLFQVFSIGQSSSGFHEMRETAENVRLDDEQVQLISDFVSDDVQDVSGSTESDYVNRASNSNMDQDGTSIIEMQSYNTPTTNSKVESDIPGSPVSFLIDISTTLPPLISLDSADEINSSVSVPDGSTPPEPTSL